MTIASVVPDIDGLGLAVDLVTRQSAHPTDLWDRYHHVLGHNLGFGLVVLVLALWIADHAASKPNHRVKAAIFHHSIFETHR